LDKGSGFVDTNVLREAHALFIGILWLGLTKQNLENEKKKKNTEKVI